MKLTRVAQEPKLVMGGEAKVDLLPPEVLAQTKAKTTRRMLAGAVVLSVVVVAAGFAYSTVLAQQSSSAVTSAQTYATALRMQQKNFIDVLGVQNELDTVTAAKAVATSTEIEWKGYLESVKATLPDAVVLTGFTVDSATPIVDATPATAPLQGERVATISFTAKSPDLPSLRSWLDSLVGLVGFVDASPGTAELKDDGLYQVSVTMHIDSDAFANRFLDPTIVAAQKADQG